MSRIAYAQDVSFASLVKVDHLLFKQNGYIALGDGKDATESLHAIQVDAHHCRLGVWYETGYGAQNFASTPSYRKLAEPHQKVHLKIQEAVGYLNKNWENDRATQAKILEAFRQAEAASDEVLAIIDRIVAEKHAR
ncbi:MAG: CZB domain-containing protein [Methylophilaceae bacterium]|nr:CZB domain-containing protein [Methylophilaceae bacterium]